MRTILAFILSLAGLPAIACTTFLINHNGQLLFGRNYDWITDAGMLYSNARGLTKTSMKTEDGKTITWTSTYGSMTFNQYGKEFPTGGMNEKGLVVELMWLDETKYPAPDQRPAVGVLQWIQYQLDNCATIDEVIATDRLIRIASVGTTPLHYLVADASGQVTTIEFLGGKLVTHKNSEIAIPVLTNSVFSESVQWYNGAVASGNNSLDRFGKACSAINRIKTEKTDRPLRDLAFDILADVAQGDFTKWSIVYDIKNKVIQFKTERFHNIKTLDFAAINFNCSEPMKAWDINQAGIGDISKVMKNYTTELNKNLVETSFRESASRIHARDETRVALWQYPSYITCR